MSGGHGSWRAGWAALAMVVVAVAPAAATGQDLARRISTMDDGWAIVTFPARPGVEICDRGLRMGERRITWDSGRGYGGPGLCENGPVRVELRVRDGRVRDVDVLRLMEEGKAGAVELAPVSPEKAVEFFLSLARTGGSSGRGLEDALLPVVLADVQDVWKDLMGLAKDRSIRSDTRSSALFWVSQEAAAVVTEGLAEVAMDQEEEQDVREAAVFALSQRPSDESVPILMELAKTADHPETRRSAMFWLAQSKDDRVLDFFEEILLGKGGV